MCSNIIYSHLRTFDEQLAEHETIHKKLFHAWLRDHKH